MTDAGIEAGAGRAVEAQTLADYRRRWEQAAQAQDLPPGGAHAAVVAGGVPCEWVTMRDCDLERVLVLLHGGGYSAGSSKTHRRLAAQLAAASGLGVLVPDYRLAPEHPHPAAVKDALLAYGWLLGEGRRPRDIAIAGDSAGGGLALSMLLALTEAAAPMPRAGVLLAPWTDLTAAGFAAEAEDDSAGLSRDRVQKAGQWYAGRRDPGDPMLSPLFANLAGLPPLLIQVGSADPLAGDCMRLAERARLEGVAVNLQVSPGLGHGFYHASDSPEALLAFDGIASFLRGQFAESAG